MSDFRRATSPAKRGNPAQIPVSLSNGFSWDFVARWAFHSHPNSPVPATAQNAQRRVRPHGGRGAGLQWAAQGKGPPKERHMPPAEPLPDRRAALRASPAKMEKRP